MAFIVIGPGIHDPIKLDTLFGRRTVDKPGAVSPKRRIEANDPFDPAHNYPDVLVRRDRDQAFAAYRQVEALHEEKPVVAARQIMSSPVLTLTEQATVAEAVLLLHARQVRHVPVTADGGVLIGMVSDRDLLHALSGLNARYEQQRATADVDDRVTALMRSPVLTAVESTDVRLIARLFVEYHIGAVPVLAGHDIIGIITRSDVLRAVMLHYGLELWV
jgi:acetoin utilization protein AcuB